MLADIPGAAEAALEELGADPLCLLILACCALIPLGHWREDVLKEMVGTSMLILTQLPLGGWLGSESVISQFLFVLAVIVTDLCAQGADMSPSGTLTKLVEGLPYARSLSRIASQLLAAAVAHLLLDRLSAALDLPLLSGPTPKEGVGLQEMCIDEAAATFLLLAVIYAATSFLSQRLWLLQELIIAGAIRYNLENLNRAGAAMNPMMGSGWAIYAASRRQALPRPALSIAPHILCYWFSSMLGAIGAWLSVRLPVLLFNRWRAAAESKAKSD